jgi:hypothetical protein
MGEGDGEGVFTTMGTRVVGWEVTGTIVGATVGGGTTGGAVVGDGVKGGMVPLSSALAPKASSNSANSKPNMGLIL